MAIAVSPRPHIAGQHQSITPPGRAAHAATSFVTAANLAAVKMAQCKDRDRGDAEPVAGIAPGTSCIDSQSASENSMI
jgi:hypothetical protein